MSPVLTQACEKAFRDMLKHPGQAMATAATKFGISPQTFKGFIARRHPNEIKALRVKLGLPLLATRSNELKREA